MNRYIKSIPLGAVLALALASVSAQTPAPAGTASAPATLGVTPQEAAKATQEAVPRSDTGTLVRTAPSPAERASGALSGNTSDTSTATGRTTSMNDTTGTGRSAMGSTTNTGSGAMGGPRRARADRN